MNPLDYAVLLSTMLGIAAYGVWRTRGRRTLSSYLHGQRDTPGFVIGLSVMATQASAITFLSLPGQGYDSGLSFVQNYFGAPFALILISAVFLPLYRRLNVYTAYEFLGRRFDTKTRLLGVALFLLQRGLGAGITLYAPAIVLSTVFHWPLAPTIVCAGLLVTAYTVAGGSDAVTHTQKYQLAVCFAGMIAAFVVLLMKLPPALTFTDALTVAGGFQKLNAVDFSPSPEKRYTFWSGLLGGAFLALAYFGTDQSQVQRYLTGSSLRESRIGLMFNAVCKIPMQFFILLLGTLLFVFYQFEQPPVFFNQSAWTAASAKDPARFASLESDFATAHAEEQKSLHRWLESKGSSELASADPQNATDEPTLHAHLLSAHGHTEQIRADAKKALQETSPDLKANDADYVFISFILHHLPHGLIGLLVAAFFASTLSSKAGELNALASTTVVDLYQHLIAPDEHDAHYVTASKLFTLLWGLVAIAFALVANLAENLIQAVNILGSLFYSTVLGLFLTAFFLKHITGTAVFYAALAAQALVLALYFTLSISYLWYNVIGCAACMLFATLLQLVLPNRVNES